MDNTALFKRNFLSLCLAALVSLALSAAPALADDTLVTWEFTKTKVTDQGKLQVFGTMTNNTDKIVTHIGPRTWSYEQNGERKEWLTKKPIALKKPLQPGGTGVLHFLLNDTSEISDFTVIIHEVTLADPEDTPPPPAQKQQTQARKASDDDFKKVKFRLLSASIDSKATGIYITGVIYNNSNKSIRAVHSKVTQSYSLTLPWEKTFRSEYKSFPPNSAKIVKYTAPIAGTEYKKGLTDAQIEQYVPGKSPGHETRAELLDIEFAPYTKPALEYGPNKGNVLWTGSGGKIKDGKLLLSTTLTNNFKEDIVAVNTYSVSFDHADGRYVSYRTDFKPKKPIEAYGKLNVTVSVSDGAAYRNVQNIKISDVSYMSRPVSARPKSKTASSSNSKFAINTKSVNRSSDKKSYVVTVEIMNNSSGQRLARIDGIAVHYEADEGGKWVGYKKTIGNKTVDIDPLATQKMKFSFGTSKMKNVRKVKVVGTPRFLDKGM